MRRLLPGRRPLLPPAHEIRVGADGLVAIGGDLAPETVLEAYRKGVFPWDGRKPYPWYSPDPRWILSPTEMHVGKTLRKLLRQQRLQVRFDTCFSDVMRGCAVIPRDDQDGTWITPKMVSVYTALHRAGIAHSVEVYEDGALVGGLYGLAHGQLFFGESMFARRRDASKVAMAHLCRRLADAGYVAVDCQAHTPHLERLGAHGVARTSWLEMLDAHWDGPDRWAEVRDAGTPVRW